MNKRIYIIIFLCSIFSWQNLFAAQKIGIMITGDSWGSLACFYNSMEEALRRYDFNSTLKKNKVKVFGCPETVEMGSKAKHWLREKRFSKVRKMLNENPEIKIMYLSVGGNDFIDNWHREMTPMEETENFLQVIGKIKKLISMVREVRSDLKIILSGYDLPNFEKFTRFKPYVRILERAGWPNTMEMNSALVRFTQFLAEEIKESNVKFIHHIGLMHYYYGNKDKGLEPKLTLEPNQISHPSDPARIGGDIRFPVSYRSVTRLWPLYRDAYHLSNRGFSKIMDHTMDLYLKDMLDYEIAKIEKANQ